MAFPAVAAAQAADVPLALRAQYDSAYFAWDRGDYPAALRHAERVLVAPGGEALVGRVAMLTGEKYRVRQLAPDGHALRWSPDGAIAIYEVGSGSVATTHLVEVGPESVREVAVLDGRGAAVSPDGNSVAYLQVPETRALTAARAAEQAAMAARDFAAVRAARAELARLEAEAARIMVRELSTGQERERPAPGPHRLGLLFTGDGSLVLVGADPASPGRAGLYLVPERGEPRALAPRLGTDARVVTPVGQRRILQTVSGDQFAVVEVPSGRVVARIDGASPAVSADGSTVAYLSREAVPTEFRRGDAEVGADRRGRPALTRLMTQPLDGDARPVEVTRSTLPLTNPALSPSGRQVAFQLMPRDSWQIFVAPTDGSGSAERVTREIQHDQFPHFISESLLVGLMGESRYRRAYLYDLDGDRVAAMAADPLPGRDQRGRVRLFHNNTLRTLAPLYEWEPTPDANRVLVSAHRDGNTLVAERGIFVIDLDRPVTRDEVLARVRQNLAAEEALRDHGRRLFAPIQDQVRHMVADVDVGRIYDHAHALYHMGSKWITEPGNILAVHYLADALRHMGYEPELQWFEPRAGHRTANVVATLRGTERPGRSHVISSHFDSVQRSAGADDNNSGTTALLEAARVLANRPQAETIQFAFLTGEEAGLLGAREFVRRATNNGDDIASVINNDMFGWTPSHRLDNTVRYSNDQIRDLQHAAAILFSDLITYDARYVRGTDAQAFYDAFGDIVGGIGSYPILGNPHYHQPSDILEVIDHRLVAEVSRATAAAAMGLASGLVVP